MPTYDQLCDEGRELDRAEMFARAEAQIRDQIADEQSEEMSRGERCVECGEEFLTALGRPGRCVPCGGHGQVSPWFIGGRYVSDPSAAQTARTNARERRQRFAARVARVAARQGGVR